MYSSLSYSAADPDYKTGSRIAPVGTITTQARGCLSLGLIKPSSTSQSTRRYASSSGVQAPDIFMGDIVMVVAPTNQEKGFHLKFPTAADTPTPITDNLPRVTATYNDAPEGLDLMPFGIAIEQFIPGDSSTHIIAIAIEGVFTVFNAYSNLRKWDICMLEKPDISDETYKNLQQKHRGRVLPKLVPFRGTPGMATGPEMATSAAEKTQAGVEKLLALMKAEVKQLEEKKGVQPDVIADVAEKTLAATIEKIMKNDKVYNSFTMQYMEEVGGKSDRCVDEGLLVNFGHDCFQLLNQLRGKPEETESLYYWYIVALASHVRTWLAEPANKAKLAVKCPLQWFDMQLTILTSKASTWMSADTRMADRSKVCCLILTDSQPQTMVDVFWMRGSIPG